MSKMTEVDFEFTREFVSKLSDSEKSSLAEAYLISSIIHESAIPMLNVAWHALGDLYQPVKDIHNKYVVADCERDGSTPDGLFPRGYHERN